MSQRGIDDMEVDGFKLLLEDFCAFCPNFDIYVQNVQDPNDMFKMHYHIYCKNIKRCTIMAENIERRINGQSKA